jgi:hypothetical protein
MIELVLVYCLSDVPDRCVERREALSENITPMQCTIDAQQRAQVYLASHPLYRLVRWRCEVDKPREQPA